MTQNTTQTFDKPSSRLYWREASLIILSGLAILLLLALVTYHHSDPAWSTTGSHSQFHNAVGPTGAYVADILLYSMGYAAFCVPFLLGALGWYVNRFREQAHFVWVLITKIIGGICVLSMISVLLKESVPSAYSGLPLNAGGLIGYSLQYLLQLGLGWLGGSIGAVLLGLAGLTLLVGWRWIQSVIRASQIVAHALVSLGRMLARVYQRVTAAATTSTDNESTVAAPAPAEPIKQEPAKPKTSTKPAKSKKQTASSSPSTQVAQVSGSDQDSGEDSVPPLDLLDASQPDDEVQFSQTELDELAQNVEARLKEFGITVKVDGVYPGPVVTRFELELAPGMKVNRITSLSKDLARSLSVTSVRVVEVIPGKSVIGLEIPNKHRATVRLKQVLQDKRYQQAKSYLSLGMGQDIAGQTVVIDVAKMPHLLVAGTTGSGKSVSINGMILSLLLRATPEEVRLLMVDPKMLELSIYEGIPHLLAPVVTDMKEAVNLFRWCVQEMERRYKLMASLSVRNLAGFNQKVRQANERGEPIDDPLQKPDSETGEAPKLEPLPQIVVVVDELADMMMVVGKKVEELIARIAQKARAAGIHMILATQRPSVDVITGLIKANIPTRVAFQVSSKIDSRTILDQQGAENLLGHGDMLYMPPGTSFPMRVHGAFVSDDEVVRVVEAWKERGQPQYIEDITADSEEDDESENDEVDAEQDPLYDQAVAIVLESQRASISYVQRRLKIGYNRAASIIEAMEKAGVVGSMEKGGSRPILVNNHSE